MGIITNIRNKLGSTRSETTETKTSNSKLIEFALSTSLDVDGYIKLADTPEVQTAIKYITRLVSSMTIHLMEDTEKGDKRIKDELAKKVDINPYSLSTRKNFIEYIVTQMILEGNAFVRPVYKGVSKENTPILQDLIPLDTRQWTLEPTKKGYQIKNGETVLNHDAILNFVLNPKRDAIYDGKGYQVALKNLAKNLNQARATSNAFMTSKFLPSVIVRVDSTNEELLTPEGREILKQRLLTSSNGEPAILPDDIVQIEQLKPLSIKDLAILETSELDKKAVASLLGVPAFVLGVGTFDKEEHNNCVSTTIREIAQIIEQEFSKLLISPNRYFRLSIRSLYSYSLTDQVSSGVQLVQLGAMYRNELRDWIGLEYSEDMEELLMLENYLDVNDLGKQKKLVQETEDEKGGE